MRRISRSAGPLLLIVYPFLLLWCILGVPATIDAFAPPEAWIFALAVFALTIALTGYWLVLAFRPARLEGWYRPRRRDWIVACAVWIVGTAGLARLVGRVLEETRAVKIASGGANTAWALHERLKTNAMLAALDVETNAPPPRLGPVPGEHATANDWFAQLLSEASIIGIDAHSMFILSPLDESVIMPGESSVATNRCIWNCLAGIDDCPSDATPFLWSANLRGVTADDFAGADPVHPRSWKDRFDGNRIPSLGRYVVVIRKNGRMDIRPGEHLTDVQFLGGSSNDPTRIRVLPARP